MVSLINTTASRSADPDHIRLEFTLNSPETVLTVQQHDPLGTHEQADVSKGGPNEKTIFEQQSKYDQDLCAREGTLQKYLICTKENCCSILKVQYAHNMAESEYNA